MDYKYEFKKAMANSGIICNENIIADGKLHRFKNAGDAHPNSWYVLHGGSLPAGAYGCWKKSISEKGLSKPIKQLSAEEFKNYVDQMKKAQALQEAERAKIHAESKNKAQQIWENILPATIDHPYLLKKKIKPHSARVNGNDLIIPIRNSNGEIESLQYITPNGNKLFLEGGAIRGNYCSMGTLTDTLYICEGFATAASVNDATGSGTIVAFNAGNLLAVAKNIRKKYPSKTIIIAADNDAFTENNIGVQKATDAAREITAKVAIPKFKDISSSPTDWNDLMCLEGIDEVRAQLTNIPMVTQLTGSDIESNKVETASYTLENETFDNAIIRLSKLSHSEYDKIRKEEAKALGIRVMTLDNLIKKRISLSSKAVIIDNNELENEIEPWYEQVTGAEIALEIQHLLKAHVILDDYQITAIMLWVLGSYCIDAFPIFPKLLLTSPTKRCGKTTLMRILHCMVNRSLLVSNTSVAAIFRSIELWKPSILIDEADTFIKDNEELRGIINSGHTKDTAYVLRVEGDSKNRMPTRFSTWSPMVIAMIKLPPDTILDRSIIINLRRKSENEYVTKLNIDCFNQNKILRQKLKRWAIDNFETIKHAKPQVPTTGGDRATDNWFPLFAVSYVLGPDWISNAIVAIQKLAAIDSDESIATTLLCDIRDIFDRDRVDKMYSDMLLTKLIDLDDRPWIEYRNGLPMTKNTLAKLLKPFGIKSKQIWLSSANKNGYELSNFKDVFNRYIPHNQNSRTLGCSMDAAYEPITNSRIETSLEFQNGYEASKHAGSRVLEFQ